MYYYKYNFVSPESLYARVKEELKSYFDTGAVDDLLFPMWTDDCLKKLGRSSYKILPAILYLDDFQTKLPPDFKYVREAWICTDTMPVTARVQGSYYTQITTRVDVTSNNPASVDNCSCNPCDLERMSIVYKTNTDQTFTNKVKHLLKPGNLSAKEHCGQDCLNTSTAVDIKPLISHFDEFDIQGNRFVTNFRQGDIYLVYYSEQLDGSGYEMVPDNFRIQDYIRKYLMYKIFQQLWNQITDETFNQIEKKMQVYKQDSDEAFIMADIEVKKQTVYDKRRAIHRDTNRFDKYNIR